MRMLVEKPFIRPDTLICSVSSCDTSSATTCVCSSYHLEIKSAASCLDILIMAHGAATAALNQGTGRCTAFCTVPSPQGVENRVLKYLFCLAPEHYAGSIPVSHPNSRYRSG